jgi:hypothetical protein
MIKENKLITPFFDKNGFIVGQKSDDTSNSFG